MLSCAVFVACTEPPTPSLRQADRQLIDSLYTLHYDSIKVALDSNCVVLQETRLEPAVDSILKRRIVEEAKLKNKYREAVLDKKSINSKSKFKK